MIELGIGPAVRVLRHVAERRYFYPLKFASGERALVLIAGMPAPSVEIVRLVLGGFIPWQTVWEYNPTRAGGYSDYVDKLRAMFSPMSETIDESLPGIRDALARCGSITEARGLLLERERIADGFTTEDNGLRTQSPSPNDHWELGSYSLASAPAPDAAPRAVVPDRYRTTNDARGRFLTCVEAPMIRVCLPRVVISAKDARNYPPGAIFLGGAAQGGPFVDPRKDVYNLDHEQGCIRSLATCEQAMLLIRKIVDLRKREWVVLANDTALDTVLALWVLLNHLRLKEDPEIRARIMPLLRLEGVIDAHGPNLQDLAALPPELLRSSLAVLNGLRRREIGHPRNGTLSDSDLLEHLADQLRGIDKLIYSPEDFAGLYEVDALARADIGNGSVAVACRSDARIAEVERQLQRIHGQRLGVLIIKTAPAAYQVRRVDGSLPALDLAYERLNLVDPAVKGGLKNQWRGSADIGGSPRAAETRLTAAQIVEVIREAFQKPAIGDVMGELPGALSLAVFGLFPAVAVFLVGKLLRDAGYLREETMHLPAIALVITVATLFSLKARSVPSLYGWRAPTGHSWIAVIPGAFVAAAIGGAWAPGSLAYRMGAESAYEFSASAVFLASLGAELLFRGVILGHLASRLPLRKTAGPWRSSWPTLISSVVYAAASCLLLLGISDGQLRISQWPVILTGSLAFGVASGLLRQRSESVIPSVLLHWTCAAALLLAGRIFS